MEGPKRVCVIGAGISGLVTAKVFTAQGHDVTVIEKAADLGGVWEPSRSYPGIQTQTPRDLYAYSDARMPAEYPEWPTGPQVHAYLRTYAERHGLMPLIRFRRKVTRLTRAAEGGWQVASNADGASSTEAFDFVAVCSGQFSQPNRLNQPGANEFRGAGGVILHSSEYTDPSTVRNKRVAVLGFSKSATDVAVNAVKEGAQEVSIIYLKPVWKIPYFFGGLLNFKRILYTRLAEAMFLPFDAGSVRRAAHRLFKPLIWANWRLLETLLKSQFKLKRCGMVPDERIEDIIHCSLGIETPGFYKMVREGTIKATRGTIERYEAGEVVVTGGRRLPCDVVVLAVGWKQELPFLELEDRAKLIDADGQYRLYRMLVNPDLPDLGFVGFNSSFATTLSAELGAHWLLRFVDRRLSRHPTREEMEREIERSLAWRRRERPVARLYGGLCIAPYHYRHFDQLLADIGVSAGTGNPVSAYLGPIDPADYGRRLQSAPSYRIEARPDAPAADGPASSGPVGQPA